MLRHLVDAAESTTAEELLLVFDRFHLMNLRLVELFHSCRILVTPTCSGLAPFAGEMTSSVNGVDTANWSSYLPLQHDPLPRRHRAGRPGRGGLPIGCSWSGPSTATSSCCAPPPPWRRHSTSAPLPVLPSNPTRSSPRQGAPRCRSPPPPTAVPCAWWPTTIALGRHRYRRPPEVVRFDP